MTKTCEQCGATFSPKRHDGPKKWAARRFCTVACSRASLVGKPSHNTRHVNTGPCSVAPCDREAVVRGMCKKHWTQWRRTGDPTAVTKPRKTDPPPEAHTDEPLVVLDPGRTGVVCHRCGCTISATTDPQLVACARANHHHYCTTKEKK
jgi:hypothetical protein